LLLIFRHCDSQIRSRIILTHTCQRWRLIAVYFPPLWTDLRIPLHSVTSGQCFDSLLTMQVNRCGALPLDVVWHSDLKSQHFIFMLFSIRDIAPFSRWGSLRLCMPGRNSFAEGIIASTVEFTNLESLVISSDTHMFIAEIFCRATTSKLKMIDLRSCGHALWEERLIRFLNRGTSPQLCRPKVGTPFLPGSIVTLCAGVREKHPFPNILNYELDECTFRSKESINLRNMTSLTINGCLTVHAECDVLLPSLQHIQFNAILIYLEGKIQAPVLQTLHIAATPVGVDSVYTKYTRHANNNLGNMRQSINSPGYLLSPKNLIVVDSPLPGQTIIELLTKSPRVTHATLRLKDWTCAQMVVERLHESSAQNERLFPQSVELLLDCGWEASDMPVWTEQWLSGLEARKENPPSIHVSIETRQRGRERYLGE
jgi:hypothetical protein